MSSKQVKLADFLSAKEIDQAIKLYFKMGSQFGFARKYAELVIEPNIERINKAVGMECHPMYLAYCVEMALDKMAKSKGQ